MRNMMRTLKRTDTMKRINTMTVKTEELHPEDDGLGAGWRDGFFEEAVEFEEEEERKEETKETTERKTKSHKRNQRRRRRLKPRVKMEPISWDAPMMWVTARWLLTDYLKMTEEEKEQTTDQERKNLRGAWKTLRKRHEERLRVEADKEDCCDNNQPAATTNMKIESKKESTTEIRLTMKMTTKMDRMDFGLQMQIIGEANRREMRRWMTQVRKEQEQVRKKHAREMDELRTMVYSMLHETQFKRVLEEMIQDSNAREHRKKFKKVLKEMRSTITRVEAMDDCVNNQPEAKAKTMSEATKIQVESKMTKQSMQKSTMESKTPKKTKTRRSKKKRKKKSIMARARDERNSIADEQPTKKKKMKQSTKMYYWNRGRPPERTKEVKTGTTTKQPKESNTVYYWYRGRPPERVQ
jgi:hypothetical protein